MGIVSNVPTPKPYTKMGNVSALKDLLDKDTIMDGSIVKAAGASLMPQEVFRDLYLRGRLRLERLQRRM